MAHYWPEVHFTPIERALLGYLVTAGARVVSGEELLREVWGYSSNAKSRTLKTTVRRIRQKIEPDEATPQHLVNLRGRGYQLVLEGTTGLPAPAPRAIARRPGKLPQPTDSFIGREKELQSLEALWHTESRLWTLHGGAGHGKTRIAHAFAGRMQQLHGCHTFYCDVSAAHTAQEGLAIVAGCAGMQQMPASLVEYETQLRILLTQRHPSLLVLDNFEQLSAEAANTVQRLVETSEDLRVLVTSREPLFVRGEVIIRVGPLTIEHAVTMLRDRVEAIRIDRTVPIEPVALQTVATLLEGVPLALEMAAARARILPLPLLAKRLATSFSVLGAGRSGGPDRQQTLHHAIDWSWQLLSSVEQAAMVQFAVFQGGCTLEMAEKVISVDEDTLTVIESLLNKSMLRVRTSDGVQRFDQYQSVREFALSHGDDGLLGARDRHGAWGAGFARKWHNDAGTGPLAGPALTAELENLLGAHKRLLEQNSPQAIDVVVALLPLYLARRLPQDFVAVVDDTQSKLTLNPGQAAQMLQLKNALDDAS